MEKNIWELVEGMCDADRRGRTNSWEGALANIIPISQIARLYEEDNSEDETDVLELAS